MMSHFYGTLQGCRGVAARCGSTDSGVTAHAASWEGAVRARVFYNKDIGKDWARVCLTPWRGCGRYRVLYNGPVDGSVRVPQEQLMLLAHVADETINQRRNLPGGDRVRVTLPREIYDKIRDLVIQQTID